MITVLLLEISIFDVGQIVVSIPILVHSVLLCCGVEYTESSNYREV